MEITERYQKNGLAEPIAIRPTIMMHLLIWGGGAFLLVGSGLALMSGDVVTIVIGLVGIVFFGAALIFIGGAMLRGRKRGLVEFSHSGLWLSSIAACIPWEDIGPAWVNTTSHAGGKTDDVVFIARRINKHVVNPDWLARLHLKLMRKSLQIEKGTAIDFGLKMLFQQADSAHSYDEMHSQLEHARAQANNDPSAALLNIPVPFRLGVSPHGLTAIINECSLKASGNDA